MKPKPSPPSYFHRFTAATGHLRWQICGLLFLATALSYIDRQIIGLLKPMLEKELAWTEMDYVRLVQSFQLAYAAGYVLCGRLIDRIGVRWGLGLAIGIWSLFTLGHGLVRSASALCLMRFGLGLAEGGNFPGAMKAVSEWFPQKERAIAKGVFTAGGTVGATIAPLFVPWIAVHWGFPAVFFLTGGIGLFFAAFWFFAYRHPEQHPSLSREELDHIQSGPSAPITGSINWVDLFRYRTTWAFTVGMALTTPIWWFYLFWVPDFLHKAYGVDTAHSSAPLFTLYLMSDFGGIAGGFLSMRLLSRGWSARQARFAVLALCAVLVTPLFLMELLHNLWITVLIIGLAGAAHQAWSSNIHALIADTMPGGTVSSIVGIGGMAGSLGSLVLAQAVGHLLEKTGSYTVIFTIVPFCYTVAFGTIFALNPFRDEPRSTPSTSI